MFISIKKKKNLLKHKKKNNEYIPTNEDNYMSQTKRSESNYLSKNEDSGLLSEDDECEIWLPNKEYSDELRACYHLY